MLPAIGPCMPRSALGGDDVGAGLVAATNISLWGGSVAGVGAVPVRGQKGRGTVFSEHTDNSATDPTWL